MIFSPPTQHALRALVYLARHGDGVPVHARAIATAEAIPSAFLAKILNRLRARGFLRSAMGPGGGYVLARPAADIRIRDIVEAFDDAHQLQRSCLMGLSECSDDAACALHARWKSFRNDLARWIDALTLEDVALRFAPVAPSQRKRKSQQATGRSRATGTGAPRRRRRSRAA